MFSRLHAELFVHCVLTNYTITFNTCNVTHTGTEDDVVIVLFGPDGTNITHSMNGSTGGFKSGRVIPLSYFNSSSPTAVQGFSVGHVCNMSVYRTGRLPKDAWKLETLTVQYPSDTAVFSVINCTRQDLIVDKGVSSTVYQRIGIENVTSSWTSWSDCDCVTGLRHRRKYDVCVRNDISLDNETCTSPHCNQTQDAKPVLSVSNLFNILLGVTEGVLILALLVICIYFQSKGRKPTSDCQAEEPSQSAVREGYDLVQLPSENRDSVVHHSYEYLD